jgi:exodeoxyribonuclease VII large subunit
VNKRKPGQIYFQDREQVDLSRFLLVTGIGHEVDFTIADFVADRRAPTPSVAAESITPDINELMQGIDDRIARLLGQVEWRLGNARERLGYLKKTGTDLFSRSH